MRKVLLFIILLAAFARLSIAQTGNTGIGTTTPGSKLTVNGSFAAAYTSITASTYSAGENDFYILWNGTAAGTITLPASTSGPNRTGRLYFFKNTSDTYTLTIDAAGTELIDNAQTVILQPGETGLLVKTNVNTASGTTYEVVQVSKAQATYVYAAAGGSQTFPEGTNNKANFTAIEFSTNGGVDFNTSTSIWTCPKTGLYKIFLEGQGAPSVPGNQSHAGLQINKNGTLMTVQYFHVPTNYNNSGSVSAIANLVAGDQISVSVNMCSGCGTGMISTRRRLEITKL